MKVHIYPTFIRWFEVPSSENWLTTGKVAGPQCWVGVLTIDNHGSY
jgi:hypothetical protein